MEDNLRYLGRAVYVLANTCRWLTGEPKLWETRSGEDELQTCHRLLAALSCPVLRYPHLNRLYHEGMP